MRLFGVAGIVAVVAGISVGAGATATPKGHVGRAFADAYVQVEADFGVSPQVLGIAHIQVHAYDFDPSHPASAFDQQSDEVGLSCTPVTGTNPCVAFPQGQTLNFVDHITPDSASISMSAPNSTVTFLTLVDDGVPGNAATGQSTATGTAITNDWIRWALPGSGISWTGYLLAGQVTVNY